MYDPLWVSFTYVAAFVLLFVNVIYIALLIKFYKLIPWTPYPVSDDELPKLSVIIPAYNESENVRSTIESVLNSDYPKDKLEIIVVDDGSTDNTYEIIKEYEKRGIKTYKKKNGGAADAKNYGAERSHGDVIATLDSDTVVEKHAFRKLVPYLLEDGVAAVTAAVRVYSPKSMIEKIQSIEYDVILFLRRLIMGVESVYVTPGGLSLFKRKPFFKVGGFNKDSLTEDQEIAINLQKHGYKIRASLDGFTYTKVPNTFFSLLNQRVRWLRGGIWNRVFHRKLYTTKSGDFLFFGMIFDFVFSIPLVIFLITMLKNIIYNGLWMERLGYIEMLILSIDPLMLTAAVVTVFGIPYVIYMVNTLRKNAGEPSVGARDILPLLLFIFVYGYIWLFVWVLVALQEFKGGGYIWGTR